MVGLELPEPLRRHAARCLITPPDEPLEALIEQRGEMRLKEGAKWMPFTAEQWVSSLRVAFCTLFPYTTLFRSDRKSVV